MSLEAKMGVGADQIDELGIGLLGCGVVGSAVARALARNADVIRNRTGRAPVIRAVAVRHPSQQRDVPVAQDLFTEDAWEVATHPGVDVVVELMGGIDPAGDVIEAALSVGKHVVTANKAVLARRFAKLQDCAMAAGRLLLFEAAVMAGTPAIATVRSLAGDRITQLQGVLNGTSNYCLHRMQAGLTLAQALTEARARGYAEADPSADIEGHDAAAKLAILATLAFGHPITADDVAVTGISGLRPADVRDADDATGPIRLVARAWRDGDAIEAAVAPVRVDAVHPLAQVRGHFNGLVVDADLAGQVFVQGPGAGGDATASAILTDLIHAAQAARAGCR
jgi:homoserine dehydrogenase